MELEKKPELSIDIKDDAPLFIESTEEPPERDDEKADVWLLSSKPEEQEQQVRVQEELELMGIKTRLVRYEDVKFPFHPDETPKVARFVMEKLRPRLPFQYSLFENLEANGTKVVNRFVPMMNAIKTTTYSQWLKKLKRDRRLRIKMPDTLMTGNVKDAKEFLERHQDVLFKPIYSAAGWGIKRILAEDESADVQLQEILDFFGYIHLQQFIPNKNFDVRTIVIGDKVSTQYARYSEHFLHNIKQGGVGCKLLDSGTLECPTEDGGIKRIPGQMTRDQVRRTKEIAKKLKDISGLDMVGTDVMPGVDGNLYLLEINPSFQFLGAEEATGVNVGKDIAEYIASLIREPHRTKKVLYFKNSGPGVGFRLNKGMDAFREKGLEVKFVRPTDNFSDIDLDDYACMIVGGGGGPQAGVPTKEFGPEENDFVKQAIERKMPDLGICLGHQIMNKANGGELGSIRKDCANSRMHTSDDPSTPALMNTKYPIFVMNQRKCYRGMEIIPQGAYDVASSHTTKVTELGENMHQFATSHCTEVEGACRRDAPVWGVQWHPEQEMSYYERVSPLLENFSNLCVKFATDGSL